MNEKYVEEKKDGFLEYTINSKDDLYFIGVEMLKEPCMKEFIGCKCSFNNDRVILKYDISEYESLDNVIMSISLKKAINIFMNIIHIALNSKHNGYIQFKNIAMNLSRIFVDNNMGIHLLYLPIEADKDDFNNLERRVKRSIASAIVKNKEFMNPVVMNFYNELSNNDKNLSDIKELLEKKFSDFIEKETIIDLVSDITFSNNFYNKIKNQNIDISSIESDNVQSNDEDLGPNNKELKLQEETNANKTNNVNNLSSQASDYNKNTNDNDIKDNNALFSNSIMNRLDEIVNKIKDKKTEDNKEDNTEDSTNEKTSNDQQINNNDNQNILDDQVKMNANQVTNQSNELYDNNLNSGNYQITHFYDDNDSDSTAVLGDANTFNQVDNTDTAIKRPVFYGIEDVKGLSIEINKDEVIIGSKENMVDVVLVGNKTVSRCHCKVLKRSDIWYIQDLGSTNGTFVNDNKIVAMTDQLINEGDVIRISNYSFIVKFV